MRKQGKLSVSQVVRDTPFAKVFDKLLVFEGVLVKGERIIILPTLTNHIIELLQESHRLGE